MKCSEEIRTLEGKFALGKPFWFSTAVGADLGAHLHANDWAEEEAAREGAIGRVDLAGAALQPNRTEPN